MALSFWRSKDFQRYFMVYIGVFIVSIAVGLVAVNGIAQNEYDRAAAQQRADQNQKITENLDNIWTAGIETGNYLQASTWVQKFMSETNAFAADFDLLHKKEYSSLLNALCASNQSIRDVAIVYPQKDTVVTAAGWLGFSGYQYYMKHSLSLPVEAAQAVEDALDGENSRPFVYSESRYLIYTQNLDLLQPPRALAVICLDKNALVKLLTALCGDTAAGVRVSDSLGNIYLECGSDLDALPSLESASTNTLLRYTVFYHDSALPLFDSLWYPLAVLGLAVLSVIIAYILASFQYFPLNRIISKVNPKASGGPAPTTIQAAVEQLYSDKENLQYTLTSYQRMLREQTNAQLLRGHFFAEMPAQLDPRSGYWYSLLLFPHDADATAALREALPQLSCGQSHCELVEHMEGCATLILEFLQQPSEASLTQAAEKLYTAITAAGAAPFPLVVTHSRKGLISIRAAYQEAREALRGREGPGPEMVVPSIRYYYPLDWENQLVAALRKGDEGVAKAILRQLYEENAALDLSGALVQRVATLLYEAMRRFVIEEKLSMQVFLDLEEPQLGMSLEEVFGSMATAAGAICQAQDKRRQESSQSVGKALVEYVDANVYDPDLSLSALSEVFGVSNASISRIYKSTAGVNFYTYVTEKRMRRAQELLRVWGYMPKEIAAEVGYDKEYSFKRAYVRQFGMTPREYVERERGRAQPLAPEEGNDWEEKL